MSKAQVNDVEPKIVTVMVEGTGPKAGIWFRTEGEMQRVWTALAQKNKRVTVQVPDDAAAVRYNGLPLRVASPAEWEWLQLAIDTADRHETVRDFRLSAHRYPEPEPA